MCMYAGLIGLGNKERIAHNRKRYLVEDKIQCPSCEEWKSLEYFHKNKGLPYGASYYCKECGNKNARKNHQKNRQKDAEDWEAHRRGYRDRYYRRVYGITLEEFEKKLEDQGFACEICGVKLDVNDNSKKAHLDHCHESEKLRGILCVNCNQGIGSMKDDVLILKKAILYLEKYHARDYLCD